MSYVVVTDSSANLTDELINEYDIPVISLSFHVGEQEFKSYEKGKPTDLKRFYDMMRNGDTITTSLVSPDDFRSFFAEFLERGQDVLYIGFSSGLSGTYQSATIAAQDLADQYPERRILTIDTLSACLGQGILVCNAAQQRREGKSIDEVYRWVTEHRMSACHWYTVDDLFFLKRGGRISGTAAVFGSLLQVKPVMHVDEQGKLTVVSKARGRKQALAALVSHLEESIIEPQKQIIGITHADCPEDAAYLRDLITSRLTVKDVVIHYLDPVLGAHAGPGTMALFFLGKTRK